jgi:uncharacterized protein (DUF736 family)
LFATREKEYPMPVIGTFARADNGYTGTMQTLMLKGSVAFVANNTKSGDAAPDFKIVVGDIEIGAAWRKTKKGSDQTYLRCRLDDPAWPDAIWAILYEKADDNGLELLWRRQRRDVE